MDELLSHISQVQCRWKETTWPQRKEYFCHLGDILKKYTSEAALAITEDMGKPIDQSIAELEKCISLCQYYAELENPFHDIRRGQALIRREPLGIILGIMPWNFPFWQCIRFALPTLLSGNAVVIKHASNCRQSGLLIEKYFVEAGFPKGLYTHTEWSHQEVVSALESDNIHGVSLTGSEEVGRKIASIAGKNLKKCVMELGGNDAFIVLKDAKLEQAARQAALARLQNAGQTCIASKRFILDERIEIPFLELFKKEISLYEPGNPFQSGTKMSGMARTDLADELQEQYERGVKAGAQILKPLIRKGETVFSPGILKINLNNPIADEEIFGPLALVLTGKTKEEILQIANTSRYGLGNSVWTQNREDAIYFAKGLESGTVSINKITHSAVDLPFGGIKASGFGTELSEFALLEFTYPKVMVGSLGNIDFSSL